MSLSKFKPTKTKIMVHGTVLIAGLVESILKIESLKLQQKYVMQHGAEEGLQEWADDEAFKKLTTLN